ncbi:unnamed protein product [Paramecium primaurelia]|uniref:Uncharacterized protein n=1 Tax=Paramecium primaurelia TaxID=5886 RepID=A0A8S1QB12_PARPR|nr:unnamed protein product [Paramecium primaurelia]
MGQQIIGKCKQCGPQNEDILPQMEFQKEIKSEVIKNLKQKLHEFESYSIQKLTTYSLKYDGLFRKEDIKKEKVIDSLGLVKPMDIEKIKQLNEEAGIKFYCGISLGDPINIGFKTINGSLIELNQNGYTLVRLWGMGEMMMNFQSCIQIEGIKLIGLVRGDIETYKKIIMNIGWEEYDHIIIEDDNILDLQYDEQTHQINHNSILSALLLYDGQVIYKHYIDKLQFQSDYHIVKKDVLEIIENGVKQVNQINVITNISFIKQQEYIKLKQFIMNQKKQSFSRDVEVTIKKKTIYYKEDKQVYYDQPIIYINSSPKSFSISDKFANQLGKKNLKWDSKLLKAKINEKIKEFSLNVQIALQKDIIISITKEYCEIKVHHWEDGILVPYYKSLDYISQIKLWITATETIRYEPNEDPVIDRINDLVAKLFQTIPKVDKVLGTKYANIPFVEKWKPPYEELDPHPKNLEIHRKSDKILLIWLFDYEIEENIEKLKELIKIKKNNPQFGLQIAILGYIKFTTWTSKFQAFLDKYELTRSILDNTIETWFPQEEQMGRFRFNIILQRIYGLMLDKQDMMIIDSKGIVRLIDNSTQIISNLTQEIDKLNEKVKVTVKNYNYWRQYQNLKKCIRENPQLAEIVKKIQEKGIVEESKVLIEQMKDKVWTFENGQIKEEKWHEQPTRILRNISDFTDINEMARIIAKYIDNNDICALK